MGCSGSELRPGLVVGLLLLLASRLAAAPDALALAHGEMAQSGAVGAVAGAADVEAVGVDEGSGAATLSIPVDLPPGPNDLSPALALSYSSGSGNGLLGVGWSLDLPTIKCSTRFGVPDLARCPRYEMGAQVLVGPDEQGAYHAFEESFDRIERVGDPAHWRVTSTNGTSMVFGAGPGSRVEDAGGIAEWHLSRITDVFGNTIELEHGTGAPGDSGHLQPSTIRYAGGTRLVSFHYEPRPDVLSSYRGGVRRVRSHRLREIRVEVNGLLHHRLMLGYETSSSSGLSRLVSIQRFGGDCGTQASPVPGEGCSALPAAELEYADTGELLATERWEAQGTPADASPWFAPVRLTPDHVLLRGDHPQFADVDGDGLVDLVTDWPGRHDAEPLMHPSAIAGWDPTPLRSPQVWLNDGVGGWVEPEWGGSGVPGEDPPTNGSARWTDALRALRFDLPTHRVKTIRSSFDPETRVDAEGNLVPQSLDVLFGTCLDPGDAPQQVEWIAEGGSVQLSGTGRYGAAPHFEATSNRTHPHRVDDPEAYADYDAYRSGGPWAAPPPDPSQLRDESWDEVAISELRPWPHFQLVDLDADGRADLVMSVRLSGFHLTLDDCASARMRPGGAEAWVEGATVTVVFMNTGDPALGGGWIRDDARTLADGNVADSLPPFGVVAFESGDLAFREIGRTKGFRNDETMVRSPCDDWGLAGQRSYWEPQASVSYDFCVTTYDLSPVFRDFDGDGYVDLMVTETADPDALFHRHVDALIFPDESSPVDFRSSATRSVVYLQDPEARGNAPRWVRAPAYDPPYEHALVLQLSGDSPGQVGVIAYRGSTGNPQTYHVDKGVRFVDFNRDGLSDMLFSPVGASLGEFADEGGVLLNRGAADPQGARHSAWCASAPVAGVDLCAEQAGVYAAPFPFSYFDRSLHHQYGAWGQQFLTPLSVGFEIVDLNGDGWPDLLTQDDDVSEGRLSRAWIHHPGRPGSVWVEDERFRPPQTKLFQDYIEDGAGLGVSVLRSGYGFLDANGDGLLDLVPSEPLHEGKPAWISTHAAASADLLVGYRNGRGHRVELEYASAIAQRDEVLEQEALEQAIAPLYDASPENDFLAEPPGPDPVVPSVDDDVHWAKGPLLSTLRVFAPELETPAETRYRYAHPRRCHAHKTALGFRLVEVTRPDGSIVETYSFQKHGRAGRVAERITRDERGRPLHLHAEEWDLPDPLGVEGGWADPDEDSGLFDMAYLGRPTRQRSRNEYGAVVGEDPGFESSTELRYDDVHGYGFVSERRDRIPGRSARVVREPFPIDPARHLVARPAQVDVYADELDDEGLLASTRYRYVDADGQPSWDRPGLEHRVVADRRTLEGARIATTGFVFASNGNLIERREYESEDGSSAGPFRSTTYCYDGDAGCPVGQGSGSLLVGVRDALGHWTWSEPDPVFGRTARTDSDYFDVPATRTEVDAFGRPVRRWIGSSSEGATRRMMEQRYVDAPAGGLLFGGRPVAYRVTRHFAEGGTEDESALESIEVSSGGDPLLSIQLARAGAGSEARWTATARSVSSDPASRASHRSEHFACLDSPLPGPLDYDAVVAACSVVSEAAKERVVTETDALGRVTRRTTPLGFELRAYSAVSRAAGEHGPPVPHDLVFRKRANGGLVQSILAADRPVEIRECGTFPEPALDDLAFATCEAPEISRLVYEPTGELRERVDPTVPESGGAGPWAYGAEAIQTLRYEYDTLGRIVSVADPDAGTSRRHYDIRGDLDALTDARGITTHTEHDALGRPIRITVDGEEGATELGYGYGVPFTRVNRVYDRSGVRWLGYDGLGRAAGLSAIIDGRYMRVRRRYDLLGRPTRVEYPQVFLGLENSVAYEYDGGFLARVCDVGVRGGDCDSPEARPVVARLDYDALRRVVAMQLPGGERRFAYDGASRRWTNDRFASAVPGGEHDIAFRYETEDGPGAPAAYDALGNPTRRVTTIGSLAYESTWGYDAQNRIASWGWREGNGPVSVSDYAYDLRGNLIQRGDSLQIFDSTERAHSIETRIEDGETWSYDYDAAGHLQRRARAGGISTHYRFDGRGRLVCVGTTGGGCDVLRVAYDGLGHRVRESRWSTDHHLGPDFRLRTTPEGVRSAWIGIRVLGQRVAYKYVAGGRNAHIGLFPGWDCPPGLARAVRIAALLLGLALVAGIVAVDSPVRAGVTAMLALAVALLPVRVWAAGGLWTVAGFTGTAVHRWVLSDAMGSSLVEIDSDGRRLRHALPRPFGGLAASSGSDGIGDRSHFAGHPRQPDTGLVYMNARWMDPESGTFLSVDPLVRSAETAQAFNGYAYAENNPISARDPSGRSVEWRIVWSDPDTGASVAASKWQRAASADAVMGDYVGANITVAGLDAGFASFVRALPSVSATGRISFRGPAARLAFGRTSLGLALGLPPVGAGPDSRSSVEAESNETGRPSDDPLHFKGHSLLFSMRELPRLLSRLDHGKTIASLPDERSSPILRAAFVMLGAAYSVYYMKMVMDNVVHQNALRPYFGLSTLTLDDAFVLGGYDGGDLSALHAEMDRVREMSSIPADAYR